MRDDDTSEDMSLEAILRASENVDIKMWSQENIVAEDSRSVIDIDIGSASPGNISIVYVIICSYN